MKFKKSWLNESINKSLKSREKDESLKESIKAAGSLLGEANDNTLSVKANSLRSEMSKLSSYLLDWHSKNVSNLAADDVSTAGFNDDVFFEFIRSLTSEKSLKQQMFGESDDPDYNESFRMKSNIPDLEEVAQQIWEDFQPDKMGEENWIEFDNDEPRKMLGTNNETMSFEAIGPNSKVRGAMRTQGNRIHVAIRNGSEGVFDSVDEIEDFIKGALEGFGK